MSSFTFFSTFSSFAIASAAGGPPISIFLPSAPFADFESDSSDLSPGGQIQNQQKELMARKLKLEAHQQLKQSQRKKRSKRK
jgi:hypothetical protein